jgi:parvulin-like peptidyl-prolyl isomerase
MKFALSIVAAALSTTILNTALRADESSSLMAQERAIESSQALKTAFETLIATQSEVEFTIGDLVAQIDRVTPGKRLTGLRSAETLNAELDRALTARILAREARKLGMDKSELFETELRQAEEQILARKLIHSRLPDFTDETLEQAARERYQITRNEFTVAEARSISHIFVTFDGRTKADALARALQVSAMLKRTGSSFEAVAANMSDDKGSKDRGGLLGDLTKGAGAPMEAEVFAMQSPGILPNPVETANGYHIVRLNKITPPRTKTFDEVKSELMAQIQTSANDNTRQALVRQLVGGDPFELNEPALKTFFSIMGAENHALFKNTALAEPPSD